MSDDYKIVNTTKLDAAMTATADKIRNKTHKTDKISWNENTGFSSEIETQNKSVTPTAAGQTVKSDTGYVGLSEVAIDGDPDLKAGNIVKGVSIFGVTGTFDGKPVAMGTFTMASAGVFRDNELGNKPLTVSGLPFAPTRVIFFADEWGKEWSGGSFPNNQGFIFYGDSIPGKCFVIEHYTQDGQAISSSFIYDSAQGFLFTLTSDGFDIRATANTNGAMLNWIDTYHYIAIG